MGRAPLSDHPPMDQVRQQPERPKVATWALPPHTNAAARPY